MRIFRRISNTRDLAFLAILWASHLLVPGGSRASTTYSIRILGTLDPSGHGTSIAQGINDNGVVVGGASDPGGVTSVFRWTAQDGMSNNGCFSPPYASYGAAINRAGNLCGFGYTRSNGFGVGFDQVPAGPLQAVQPFSGAGDWYAYGISETDLIVGWSNAGQGCGSPLCTGNPGRALSWTLSGDMTVLPDLGGYCSAATWVSPDGSMICGYGADPSGAILGFRLHAGLVTPLPPLPGYSQALAYGVNDAGQVVGLSIIGETFRATLWNDTTPIDLGVPDGAISSVAIRIAGSGIIVGYTAAAGPVYHAALFQPGVAPTDLNTLLSGPSPYNLLWCNGINSLGQIVGDVDSLGTRRGFVLTPDNPTSVSRTQPMSPLELRTPNPTAGETDFRFSLPESGNTSLVVVDVGGGIVARLVDGWNQEGEHAVRWNGRDDRGDRLPSGVFLIRLTEGSREATRKLVLRR